MKYEKNYLTQVIFQLNFSPILKLDTSPGDFQEQIKEQFPHPKEGQEIKVKGSMSLKGDMKTDMSVESVRKRWMFFSEDESKSITIASNLFNLEYKKYQNLEATRKDFNSLWKIFQDLYHVETLERVGLRYINQIVLPSGDPLDWREYIDEEIIAATLGVPTPADHRLCRSTHATYWLDDDHRITFQFGIQNSDFPNPLVKREFVLDYDCSSMGPTDASDAENCLIRYNELIDTLFELNIGNGLREDMGVIKH
ncbi:MAG: TIGR04255 family protein [Chloroflexi bacterium]|nr:TIGR04255 family protein [Chloroflexota bacterium]